MLELSLPARRGLPCHAGDFSPRAQQLILSHYLEPELTMECTVKLFANFRLGRFKVEKFDLEPGSTCRDVVKSLSIDEAEIGVLLINGRHVTLEQALQPCDILAIFPLVGGG